MGDAVIAAFFAEDKPKAREKKRAEVESWLGGSPVAWDKLAAMAATLEARRASAHAVSLGDRVSGGVCAGERRVRCDRRKSAVPRGQEHLHQLWKRIQSIGCEAVHPEAHWKR